MKDRIIFLLYIILYLDFKVWKVLGGFVNIEGYSNLSQYVFIILYINVKSNINIIMRNEYYEDLVFINYII